MSALWHGGVRSGRPFLRELWTFFCRRGPDRSRLAPAESANSTGPTGPAGPGLGSSLADPKHSAGPSLVSGPERAGRLAGPELESDPADSDDPTGSALESSAPAADRPASFGWARRLADPDPFGPPSPPPS